jgi:hypothetical protein
MAEDPGDPRDYEAEVSERNEVRHKAQLALLDVEAEAARLRQLDRDRTLGAPA